MGAPRRADYDTPEFRELWFSTATLEQIAEKYGVCIATIWQAARRRGYPYREIVRYERRTGERT